MQNNDMRKFKIILFTSLGGLFFLWILFHKSFDLRLPRIIAEINLCQGTFCLILSVIFFIKLLLWSKKLFHRYFRKEKDEKFIPITFSWNNHIITSVKEFFSRLKEKIQNSLLRFYTFAVTFIPNDLDILLFFTQKFVDLFSIKRGKLLVLLFDILPRLVVCNIFMLALIISGGISSFYESLILLLIPFVYHSVIVIFDKFQISYEEEIHTVMNIIPNKGSKYYHSYSFEDNIRRVNNMDIETYIKIIAYPIMMLRRCSDYLWMYKDIYNTVYLYTYLIYMLDWGYLGWIYFIPRIIKCFTSII